MLDSCKPLDPDELDGRFSVCLKASRESLSQLEKFDHAGLHTPEAH